MKDTEEIDLRNISKWLRENSSKYLNKFIPENYNTEITPIKDAIRVATHYLMIFFVMCKGKSVSDNDVEALNEIISLKLNTSDNREKYFSNDLNKIFNSLPEIIEEMKNFLLNNTNVPQGSSKNINFINSYEIIKSIRENREILNVQSISDENFNGIFKTEFSVFKHQNKFSKLKEYLIEEKHSLQSMLNKVRQIFKRFGFKDNFDKENIKNWITDFDNLIKVSKDNDLYYNNDQELDYIMTIMCI